MRRPELWHKLRTGADPVLMGVVNVTPDSFSDGGRYLDIQVAISHGLKLFKEGAQILDIGGESTRPGSTPVSPEEEQARILPVMRGLANQCNTLLSVDTRNASTMLAAIDAGADMVNDVTALTYDPKAMDIVAETGVAVCLMHMQGDPQTMQNDPTYKDVVRDIFKFLKDRIDACLSHGIRPEKIMVDPGIGFGKTLEHNLEIIRRIDEFHALGVPVLLGASRKSFIEKLCPGTPPDQRLSGSLAAALAAHARGVGFFRVHDVAETMQALKVANAIANAAL